MLTRLLEKILTFLFDIIAINVAFVATFWLRYRSNLFPETVNPHLHLTEYTFLLFFFTACWLLIFFFAGLYRTWYKESRFDEFVVVSRTVLFGIFLLFLITGAPQIMEFARTGKAGVLFTRTKAATIVTYGGCMLFFATMDRFMMHTFLAWLFCRGIGVMNILVIGANDSGRRLVRDIRRYPQLGYRMVGFIDDDGRKKNTPFEEYPVFGTYSDIPEVVRDKNIGGLIISKVSSSPNEILKIITYCSDINATIYVVPSLTDVISGHLKTHQIFGVPLMVLLQDHMPAWEAQIKRILDIAVSIGVMTLGAPLLALIAVLVRMTSPGPALYRQERAGRYGKTFRISKFRSMFQDAEKYSGPQWAARDDPRITPLGRFLRKTRLDELPQFINILKGEMSLVGPRPERPVFIEELKKEIPWYIRRLKMKPGLTGWAQVKHKYDASIEDVEQKVLYDLYYFENMSVLLDIKIIILTVWVVLTGRGAH